MLLVSYDIADDRRRVRLHTLLTAHGVQVQESVFECDLPEPDAKRLRGRIRRLARPGDNIRIYTLCASCAGLVTDASGTKQEAHPATYLA